jgi:hypothetical protein
LPKQEVAIRGRAEPVIVRAVISAKLLSTLVDKSDIVAV